MQKRTHFTIVELIVVIAVLAILASLLSPSLKSAVQTAQQGECSNQMRSIHLAFELYESDHREFPGVWKPGKGGGMWAKTIWSYAGLDESEYGWDTYSHRRGTKKNLFHCPVTYETIVPSKGWTAYSTPGRESSYAYNASLIWKHRPNLYWQDKWKAGIQASWLDKPDSTSLLSESQHHVITALTQYAPHVIEPHFMKRNVLSWDGHIETVYHEEVTSDFNHLFWSGIK